MIGPAGSWCGEGKRREGIELGDAEVGRVRRGGRREEGQYASGAVNRARGSAGRVIMCGPHAHVPFEATKTHGSFITHVIKDNQIKTTALESLIHQKKKGKG